MCPLARETDKDETLVTLKNVIIKGWPSTRSECPQNLIKFWTFSDELSILDGVVFERNKNSNTSPNADLKF